MNIRVLIDSIVRQITILIAQLSTTGGIRAPLAHIANQVFLQLVMDLEQQGVGRKVIADMFGMALRSYQQKVQRLSEGATSQGISLWEATYQFMQDKEVATRNEILEHFRCDNESSIRGILHDLVESGLLYRSGRGHKTVYRIAPESDLLLADHGEEEARTALVWLCIYRDSPATLASLEEELSLPREEIERSLKELEADGRVARLEENGEEKYTSSSCIIPVGDEVGWEVSLFDHFQAVITSIVLKLQNGHTRALPSDQIGGSTFRFDIWDGHPQAEEVRSLLAKHRQEMGELWDRVAAYCEEHPEPRDKTRVTFYFGQSMREEPANGDAEEEECP